MSNVACLSSSSSSSALADGSCLPCPGSHSLGCASAVGTNQIGHTGVITRCKPGYVEMGAGQGLYSICCAPGNFAGGFLNHQNWYESYYSPAFLNCLPCLGTGVAECVGKITVSKDHNVIEFVQSKATACTKVHALLDGKCRHASWMQGSLDSRETIPTPTDNRRMIIL